MMLETHATFSPEDVLIGVEDLLASEQYLRAADWLILEMPAFERALQESKLRKVRGTLFRALVYANPLPDIREVGDSVEFEDLISRNDLPQESRVFFSVALGRLSERSNVFSAMPTLSHKALRLIDEVLGPVVYPRIGVRQNAQSHEKRQKLNAHVRKVEDDFQAICAAVPDLEGMEVFRNRLLKFANAPHHRIFLSKFLPERLLENELADALKQTADFATSPRAWNVRTFEQVQSRLGALASSCHQLSTKYALIIARVAESISGVIESGFRTSPASQPPRMNVECTDKKYALQQVGNTVWLTYRISNEGPGDAIEVGFSISASTSNVELPESTTFIGSLPAKTDRLVEIAAEVVEASTTVLTEIQIDWRTAYGVAESLDTHVEHIAQSGNVDWDWLGGADPYSSEPVTTTENLVGRRTILNELFTRSTSQRIGSAYVWGQKRVGKTSIARTLQTLINHAGDSNVHTVYLEAGAFGDATAEGTIRRLGTLICKSIQDSVPQLQRLQVPEFDNSLGPLYDYVHEARRLAPDFRILVILDEFDELPQTLYRRTELGDQFFLSLRSLSGLGYFGLVLVGGEKMEFVINFQGDRLNKFKQFRVDYFDLREQWNDFADLVRKPVEGDLEFSDEALRALFDYTAGNPFFTKLIGQEVLKDCVDRRDAFVSEQEVRAVTHRILDSLGINSFQHFWEDGIYESELKHEEVSISRKAVLALLASNLTDSENPTIDSLIELSGPAGLAESTIRREIQDFARRGILTLDGELIGVRLRLFHDWLKYSGAQQLITSFADQDLARERKAVLESQRVTSGEITSLVERWGVYRGKRITEELVRAWLEQFRAGEERRNMFELLGGVVFYTADEVRQRMREGYQFVERNSPGLVLDSSRSKRSEFLVSSLGGPAKSGSRYTKLFADENNLYAGSVIEYSAISDKVREMPNVQALVFVDDFCGSGESLSKQIARLKSDHGESLAATNIRVFVLYVTGYMEGVAIVEQEAENLGVNLRVSVSVPLGDADRCFSETSMVFRGKSQRQRIQEVAQVYGRRLQPSSPLGYKNSQSLVVFEHNCPNNTLPILWSTKDGWTPLFER